MLDFGSLGCVSPQCLARAQFPLANFTETLTVPMSQIFMTVKTTCVKKLFIALRTSKAALLTQDDTSLHAGLKTYFAGL